MPLGSDPGLTLQSFARAVLFEVRHQRDVARLDCRHEGRDRGPPAVDVHAGFDEDVHDVSLSLASTNPSP